MSSSSSSSLGSIAVLAALGVGGYMLYNSYLSPAATNKYSEQNFYGQKFNSDNPTYFRNVEAAWKASDGTDADYMKRLRAMYGK